MGIFLGLLCSLSLAPAPQDEVRIDRVAADTESVMLHVTVSDGRAVRVCAAGLWQEDADMTASLALWEGVPEGGVITLPRHSDAKEDRLYQKYALADLGNGALLCAPRCVTDLAALPGPGYTLTRPAGKKGVSAPSIPEDVFEVGAQHVALNFLLSAVLRREGEESDTHWEADGRRFAINTDYLLRLDREIKQYSDAGLDVTLIVLNAVPTAPDPANPMIHPATDLANAPFHLGAFNTTDERGVLAFRAAMECTAQRYSRPDAAHGRVSGYIIGNEIGSHWEWCNIGRMEMPGFTEHYGRAMRLADLAVRQAHPDARVYISLDHHWTATFKPDPFVCFAGKPFLELFNARAIAAGNYPWHVAFHPYPANLYDPRTWDDQDAVPSLDSPKVTFKNIEVLTAFLRQEAFLFDGAPRSVILSEQGFHSPDGPDGEDLQAAAFAYAWNRVKDLDGIDAFIYYSQVDFDWPGGLRVGLWTQEKDAQGKSVPGEKKRIHGLLRTANTPEWEDATAFALPIIGIESWDEVAPVEIISGGSTAH